YQQGYNTPWTF
nr:immunoglobulin light chain junction region [Macaca mulatta]